MLNYKDLHMPCWNCYYGHNCKYYSDPCWDEWILKNQLCPFLCNYPINYVYEIAKEEKTFTKNKINDIIKV